MHPRLVPAYAEGSRSTRARHPGQRPAEAGDHAVVDGCTSLAAANAAIALVAPWHSRRRSGQPRAPGDLHSSHHGHLPTPGETPALRGKQGGSGELMRPGSATAWERRQRHAPCSTSSLPAKRKSGRPGSATAVPTDRRRLSSARSLLPLRSTGLGWLLLCPWGHEPKERSLRRDAGRGRRRQTAQVR